MTAKEGRKRLVHVVVAVGNGKGAAGFGVWKATEQLDAFGKAKNKAIHYFHYIEQYEDHTRYGLHCHWAIITICWLIGIKDMYTKVSGAVNMLILTQGLFRGLSLQVTFPGA